MAYFALVNTNNVVEEVIRVSNQIVGEPTLDYPDTEAAGRAFIANVLNLPGTWLQCSYNATFRGAYPGPNWTYDPTTDTFNPPAALEETTDERGN